MTNIEKQARYRERHLGVDAEKVRVSSISVAGDERIVRTSGSLLPSRPEASALKPSPRSRRSAYGSTEPPQSGRRELVFPPLPYIAVYQVKENAVEISLVFHGAERRERQ